MRALCWYGKKDVQLKTIEDPKIEAPDDIIVRVTLTAICGSDLHLYNGFNPMMHKGDVLGHEFMGEVVEAGPQVRSLQVGDRVIVPCALACGTCFFCKHELWALCDNSNPDAAKEKELYGDVTSGLFGYSHLYGGFAGGQAQYVRVPYANVGPVKVPDELGDEQVIFLTDIFPTGYMAAERCRIRPDMTIAVWGCGPVGQFAIQSARLMGAKRIIAIDRFPERLEMAKKFGGAETLNYEEGDTVERLQDITQGHGPDACIDAVGMEAHGTSFDAYYDKAKQAVRLETDRPTALRWAIQSCRKGGTVSIPGVYTGFIDKFPIGAAFAKSLNLGMGQTHFHKYMRPLMKFVQEGKIDPTFVITHRLSLEQGPEAYKIFNDKQDQCVKVVMRT